MNANRSTVWPYWSHNRPRLRTHLTIAATLLLLLSTLFGASGHYMDDLISPDLKHMSQDYVAQYSSHDACSWRSSAERHCGSCLTRRHHRLPRKAPPRADRNPNYARYWAKTLIGENRNQNGIVRLFNALKKKAVGGRRHCATSRRRRRCLPLELEPGCGWIWRKEAWDRCGGQFSSVPPAAGSPHQAQP